MVMLLTMHGLDFLYILNPSTLLSFYTFVKQCYVESVIDIISHEVLLIILITCVGYKVKVWVTKRWEWQM